VPDAKRLVDVAPVRASRGGATGSTEWPSVANPTVGKSGVIRICAVFKVLSEATAEDSFAEILPAAGSDRDGRDNQNDATTISNSISGKPLFFFFMDELQPASVWMTIMASTSLQFMRPFFGASPKVPSEGSDLRFVRNLDAMCLGCGCEPCAGAGMTFFVVA